MSAIEPMDPTTLRSLLDQANSAVLLADREGAITYANREAGRMLGRSQEGIIGSGVETLFHVDQPEGFNGHWQAACSGKPVTGLAAEVQRADGQASAAEMSLLPLILPGGLCVQINLQSLAVVKAAEAQSEEAALLLAKQRRAQCAVESILKALKQNDNITVVARICLMEAAKATGAQLGLVYTCDGQGTSPRPLAAYLPGDTEPGREAISGAPALIERAISQGKILGLADLPEDTELYLQTGSWKKKPGGIAVHPLTFRDEIIGALLLAGLRPFSLEDSQFIQLLAEQIGFVIAHARVLARSENMAHELTAKSEALEGHNDELLKRSEELFSQDVAIIAKDKELKKVEKLKRDFMEKMSRELRAPLNRIIQHLIFILSNEEMGISEESMGHLRSALGEGTAFSRTLNNIVDLWRLKESQIPVDRKLIQFEAVVDEAIHHVQQLAFERQVTIDKDLEGVTAPFSADLGKLTQVMTEIIGNAVKFTSKGNVKIVGEILFGDLICKVIDNGIGMAADDRPKAFEEFFQVDETGSSGFQGAGLGLCIAKHLTELMDGVIELDSEIGQGTTVTVKLPGKASRARARALAAGQIAPEGEARGEED